MKRLRVAAKQRRSQKKLHAGVKYPGPTGTCITVEDVVRLTAHHVPIKIGHIAKFMGNKFFNVAVTNKLVVWPLSGVSTEAPSPSLQHALIYALAEKFCLEVR